MNLQALKKMPDRELLVRVKQLVQNERRATATLVAHLVEIDCRKLYLEEGCSSLFNYCVQTLHLSEHAAYNRIEAARIAVRFPLALAHLAAGDVHLTALRLVSPLLTDENHQELLAATKHQSKRQVEELIARLRPLPDVQAVVRRLPGRPVGPGIDSRSMPAAMLTLSSGAAGESLAQPEATSNSPSLSKSPSESRAGVGPSRSGAPVNGSSGEPRRPAVVVQLAPERYKVQFTASAATHGKLRRAQELLRHRIPDGDVAAVIDEALDLLVRQLEKKKFAATVRPQRLDARPDDSAAARSAPALSAAHTTPVVPMTPVALAPRVVPTPPAALAPSNAPGTPERSRHIPAAVKRVVWQRDGGQCAFVGANGTRCTERGQLEFDHVHPHADGGVPAADNLRLLCRQHNQYEAHRFFGVWQADEGQLPQPGMSQALTDSSTAPTACRG